MGSFQFHHSSSYFGGLTPFTVLKNYDLCYLPPGPSCPGPPPILAACLDAVAVVEFDPTLIVYFSPSLISGLLIHTIENDLEAFRLATVLPEESTTSTVVPAVP